jgi:hypothetical protein
MDVIKTGNFSNFNDLIAHLAAKERDDLEELEKAKGTSINGIKKMDITQLRKNHPKYLLPPLQVLISSTNDPHPDYHCPYCHVKLNDEGDSYSCQKCSGYKKWLK